jgi:hypothetical protein
MMLVLCFLATLFAMKNPFSPVSPPSLGQERSQDTQKLRKRLLGLEITLFLLLLILMGGLLHFMV